MHIRCLLAPFLALFAWSHLPAQESSLEQSSQPAAERELTSETTSAIAPMEGSAWLGADGMRAAWLSYKQIDAPTIASLKAAHVNCVFLKHGFHDLLNMDSAQWRAAEVSIDANQPRVDWMLRSTHLAASQGIHVFWVANYELEQMLPHLQRLGYQQAFAEGPGRYLRSGLNQDAAPLDPTFWRGITATHGDLIAELSRTHPIDGLLYDIEHYAGGMMYLHNSGFSDATYAEYCQSRKLDNTARDVPAGSRYAFLRDSGQLDDYYLFLEESAYEQGRYLAERWHAKNPHLVLGIWPLLENWYSEGFLRGLGDATPAIGLSGVEYYHGAEQTASMADFFERRNENLIYAAGFYPPYAYATEQLGEHVEIALRSTKHYWMLGPHAELIDPSYQRVLAQAHRNARPQVDSRKAVDLSYRLIDLANSPKLVVEIKGDWDQGPRLSLWSQLGGAALCDQQLMERDDSGHWRAVVELERKLSNNRFLTDRFDSGASYRCSPTPRERGYDDRTHTKLTDGRGYGLFGSTLAWAKSVKLANVDFDLHRSYRITKVQLAQPIKLEDRVGGPARMTLRTAEEAGKWQIEKQFEPHFAVSGKDYSEPDNLPEGKFDPRHNRSWLSWQATVPRVPIRYLQIELKNQRPNSSLSLGEVVITGLFEGQLAATLELDGKLLKINRGREYIVQFDQ